MKPGIVADGEARVERALLDVRKNIEARYADAIMKHAGTETGKQLRRQMEAEIEAAVKAARPSKQALFLGW